MIADTSQETYLFLQPQFLNQLLRLFIKPALATRQGQHSRTAFFLVGLRKRSNQTYMILARLQRPYAKYQRVFQAIFVLCSG